MSSLQNFEEVAHGDIEHKSAEAKKRHESMQKIGYKGEETVEADEVLVITWCFTCNIEQDDLSSCKDV